MHIIADSGSSKTDWVLCQGKLIKQKVETIGFNPYYFSSDVLEKIIHSNLLPAIGNNEVTDIYFYGSGCSTDHNKKIIIDALRPGFKNASIHIYHDLLGAARSLFGREKGIAGILGTGSNSGVYDGNEITHNVASLGYLFGDDGSGSNLGKRLLNEYLSGGLPSNIKKDFDDYFGFSFEHILNQIYNSDSPVKFFASLNPFIANHIDSEYLHHLVLSAFNDYFRLNICKYPDFDKFPLKFTGSIAHIFSDILRKSALAHGLTVLEINKNPLEGLIRFHA